MNLLLAGLDHTTAPVEIRERLAFNATDIPAALLQLTMPRGHRPPLFSEAVILSTCNRVELYGVSSETSTAQSLASFLAEFHGLDEKHFVHTLFFVNGESVAHHLCATSSGLRSLVLGEAQIQGQVRTAFEIAQQAGTVGPVLHRLFQHALTAGKRVRHETELGQGAASVSQAGVMLARQRLGQLQGRSVLLVGSGEVSELAAQNLLANGADRLMIVNRTLAHGRELANRYGAEALTFDELPSALVRADIVISSTSAPVPIIYHQHVADAMHAKAETRHHEGAPPSMLLIDLAVPRDIATDVAQLPGVHVCTVDDLHEVVRHTLDHRAEVSELAESISNAEVEAFLGWMRTQDAVPTLTSLRDYAESLRSSELDRALRRLSSLSPEQRVVVEALSRSIVNKLLHSPTRRLRDAAAQGDGQRYAAMLSDLFNLEHANAVGERG
ncbi:glutamyl-tRNA reductase [Oscillochloris sp. ZM17-4]|uniref:glutamyl-tRNA reductase n=1 Tax=Oscillochloris sp. ZM17-4 TaxID=2866714 RepID=UPI001C731EC9|nr:glutamyl-tRNA reductase [Oscillochloris sp. ZM17-4]MBX0326373.1 glutamyl-tRNA reductase [Oscillochloris sp. ZM17-4]